MKNILFIISFCLFGGYSLANIENSTLQTINSGVGVDILQEFQAANDYLVSGSGCGLIEIFVLDENKVVILSSGEMDGTDFSWRFSTENWAVGNYKIVVVTETAVCELSHTITRL